MKKYARRVFSRISILALIAGLVGGLFLPQSVYAATPFDCAGAFYMSRDPGDGTGVQLYKMNRSENVSVAFDDLVGSTQGLTIGGQPYQTADPGAGINALGYNPVDSYFYAVRVSTSGSNTATIFRISSDGVMDAVGTLDTTNIGDDEVWGATFDKAGNMYVKSHYAGMEVIHGLANAPTTPFTQTSLSVSIDIHMGDIAWDFSSDMIYAIGNSEQIYTINPTTGAATLVTQSGVNASWPSPTNGPGALFLDADNNLFSYENSSGKFFHINKTTGEFTLLEQGAVAANTDGASCVPATNRLDVVKSAGTVIASSATTFTVPYTITVGNKGIVTDPNVQMVDNLDLTFAEGTPTKSVSGLKVDAGTCTVNTAYNGTSDIRLLTGTDTFAPGATCTISFSVGLVYASASQVPSGQQLNTVLASSSSAANNGHYYSGTNPLPPTNLIASDTSTDDANLPTNPNGDTPKPTPVILTYTAPQDPKDPPAIDPEDPPVLAKTGQPIFLVGGVAISTLVLGAIIYATRRSL